MAGAAGKHTASVHLCLWVFFMIYHPCNGCHTALHPQHLRHRPTLLLHVELQCQNAVPDNSSELLLLNLQIEKQQLEIHLLGLKVEAKAQSLVPTCPSKQFTISSLDTV